MRSITPPPAMLPFDNSYAGLPPRFYARTRPEPVSSPQLICVNRALATQLGLDGGWLASTSGVEFLAGNYLPEGAEAIATAYAGHQFGHWVPQLGDGRAVLLGELIGADGRRYDIQLKGSGRTPYSRGGDGRSPLGPVLREYLVSEAMTALGIPSTRSLAAVTTGDDVWRDCALPGAVLTRVAQSHIRVGTFQYFAGQGDTGALRLLTEHVIDRHYPEAREAEQPCLALLAHCVSRQAQLIAHWQLIGFIHGVMNTDNTLLSGETIDYGPCAFMDAYHPGTVFSAIDRHGRYAYDNQPRIAHWNMVCLAQALLPLLGERNDALIEQVQAAVDGFPEQFDRAYRKGVNKKLGLAGEKPGDSGLAGDFLALLAEQGADFTLAFRRLSDLVRPDSSGGGVGRLFEFGSRFEPWLARWRKRLQLDEQSPERRQAMMYAANPAVIPRNHQIEAVIAAASDRGDFAPFHALAAQLAAPCDYQPSMARYASPPAPDERVTQTFCGT